MLHTMLLLCTSNRSGDAPSADQNLPAIVAASAAAGTADPTDQRNPAAGPSDQDGMPAEQSAAAAAAGSAGGLPVDAQMTSQQP